MRAAIIQSNYLPWKGYFDIINEVDVFIFEDDLQFTERDWRNRNRFKTPAGLKWLTVPVRGGRFQCIDEVCICYERKWIYKHLETIRRSYKSTKHLAEGLEILEPELSAMPEKLSVLNQNLIKRISAYLGIKTVFLNAREMNARGIKDDRLIDLCKKCGANEYLSGPSAKSYIVPEKFQREGIRLLWKDYSGYPEYPQLYPPFEHHVSVLDMIFHLGKETPYYIWGWRK